ncbi:MAG: glycosyltransferase family 1 protein [Casimicrobiaceae bacterium]
MSNPAMRIAVDASSLLTRHPRGEGKSLLRLYEEIARIRPGWSFVFFGTQETEAAARAIRARIPRCEIRTFELPGFRWNWWENLGLPIAAWRAGADLLHCASSGAPVWSPLPMVMTVHDVIPLIMDDGMDARAVQLFRTRLQAGMRLARRVIAVSENTRRDLIRVMGADPNKIEVAHWGADAVSETYGERPATGIVLGFGGGGAVRKNTPALVRMFATVAAGDPAAKLVILGATDARQKATLQALIGQLGLEGRVSLLGYVPDEELDRLYREAACLVYISLYEGFGLPPLEVMVHGMPVVASNRSSIPEVVGDAGILVDPENIDAIADAVLRLLHDQAFRHQLSEKAWRRAREFSWRATAERTASIFEDVFPPLRD